MEVSRCCCLVENFYFVNVSIRDYLEKIIVISLLNYKGLFINELNLIDNLSKENRKSFKSRTPKINFYLMLVYKTYL